MPADMLLKTDITLSRTVDSPLACLLDNIESEAVRLAHIESWMATATVESLKQQIMTDFYKIRDWAKQSAKIRAEANIRLASE